MRYLLILMLIGFTACTKSEPKQCVCQDYGNGFEEVERTSDLSETQCISRQAQWMQIKPDVKCNLQ